MLGTVHGKLVFNRRVQKLAAAIAERLPRDSRVLDVGCGSGDLAALVMQLRPDVRIEGIDVLVRPDTAIPVHAYNGSDIPFPDNSFVIGPTGRSRGRRVRPPAHSSSRNPHPRILRVTRNKEQKCKYWQLNFLHILILTDSISRETPNRR